MSRALVLPIAFAVACWTSAGPAPVPVNQAVPRAATPNGFTPIVKAVMRNIEGSPSTCDDFDYFPAGGMQSFACHAQAAGRIDLRGLIEAAGFDPFVSGPHRDGKLDRASTRRFGVYDPRFVRWMVAGLEGALVDREFVKSTRGAYRRVVRPLASVMRATYEKFQKDPACLKSEVTRYRDHLTRGTLAKSDYERLFFFLSAHFCANPDEDFDFFHDRDFDGGVHDGNVVKTAAAFWIRRTIDGTAPAFYEGLVALMTAYGD